MSHIPPRQLAGKRLADLQARIAREGVRPSDMKHPGLLTAQQIRAWSPDQALTFLLNKQWGRKDYEAWWKVAVEDTYIAHSKAQSISHCLIEEGVERNLALLIGSRVPRSRSTDALSELLKGMSVRSFCRMFIPFASTPEGIEWWVETTKNLP